MKRRKYLGISLTKEMNNLYPEFMRQRVKQLKGAQAKGNPVQVEELILLCLIYPNVPPYLVHSYQSSSDIFANKHY